jgi:UDP-glucose 4-epimerase
MDNERIKTKSILIIGGAGLVGVELVKKLKLNSDLKIVVMDTDSTRLNELDLDPSFKFFVDGSDTRKLAQIIANQEITGIIHLAANSDIKAGADSSDLDFQKTLKTSISLSEIVKKNSFDFVLFSSTSAVYGEVESPISMGSHQLKVPISNYGWAKLGSEYALKLASAESNTSFILARFPNVVGSNPTHGVLYDFKYKLKRNTNVFEILGNGEQTKPYLHVEDLCNVLIRAINLSETNPFIELNIGPGDTISLKEIVSIVLEISGCQRNLIYGESSFGWVGDVTKYEYADDLPIEYSDIRLRNSRIAIYDAFIGFWND